MSVEQLERARQTWDAIDIKSVRSVAWCSFDLLGPKIGKCFHRDDPNSDFIHNLLAERLAGKPLTDLKGAALVCGDMASERVMFESPGPVRFGEVDGFDVSPVSLRRYEPEGIIFNAHVCDCNELELTPDSYDLVVGSHGIHHVANLKNLFAQAASALKDHGLFYMFEWIGPNYLQFPRRNIFFARVLLFLLHPSRKTRTTHMGVVKGRWLQYDPQQFDPSEACNSVELYPEYLEHFKPIKSFFIGGLLYPVYEGIAQNIDERRPLNRFKIRLVYWVDRLLTRLGLIHPLFVLSIGEKRAG